MTRTYTDLQPTFADDESWTSPKVLRHHASHRPDATFLIAPEERLRVAMARQ